MDELVTTLPEAYGGCNASSLYSKVRDTIIKSRKLSKHKDLPKYKIWQDEDFRPPARKIEKTLKSSMDLDSKSTQKIASVVQETQTVVRENKILREKLNETETENTELEIRVEAMTEKADIAVKVCEEVISKYKDCSRKVQKERSEMRQELESMENQLKRKNNELDKHTAELATLREKMTKAKLRKRSLDSKEQTVKRLKHDMQDVRKENVSLTKENDKLWETVILNEDKHNEDILSMTDMEEQSRAKIQMLKTDRHNFQKQLSRARQTVEKTQEERNRTQEYYNQKISDTERQITDLQKTVRQLEGVIECTENNQIKTFENGQYTNEIREVCMTLLTEGNVSMRKLPKVIETVCRNLTGSVPERIPSRALLSSTIMMEAKIVACKQAAEALLVDFKPEGNTGSTLRQDATTFAHVHYEGIQATLQSGKNVTIGLQEEIGSDAQTYLKSFERVIDNLAASLADTQEEKTTIVAKLITSFKSLLSDQAAVNGVFNHLVEQTREKLLPNVIPGFDSLPESRKLEIIEMGTFACRMHLLINLDPAASRALRTLDETVAEGTNPYSLRSEESGTHRLARTASELFTRRGSQAAGKPILWETFLKGRNRKNKFVTYHGHRMNIAFYESAALYYHWDDVVDFLQDMPDENNLIKSVRFDIKEVLYKAGCRAMGLLYTLVMEPFERKLKESGNILDLNEEIQIMASTLSDWSTDGSAAMQRRPMFQKDNDTIADSEVNARLFGS